MRDLAEKKYGKVPTGDAKPNSWTLLDFGKCGRAFWICVQSNFLLSCTYVLASKPCYIYINGEYDLAFCFVCFVLYPLSKTVYNVNKDNEGKLTNST